MVLDEDSLSCKYCFEILQEPRVLPCGHSMCHRCIMTNVNFKKLKLKEPFLQASYDSDHKINKLYGCDRSKSDQICFNCPTCNKESKLKQVEEVAVLFPVNHDLKSAVENYMQEKVKGEMCANCECNPVQVECEDCISGYCEECFKSIHSHKVFASHKMAALGTIVTVGKCKKHKKDLDLICKNCKVVVCHLCSLSTNHNSHSCVPIDEHMEEAKTGMSKKIKKIASNISSLTKALGNVSSVQGQLVQNQEAYELKINTLIDLYLVKIEEKRKSLLEEGRAEHKERMAIMKDQHSTMAELIENMNGIRGAFEKVLQFKNVTSLITAEIQIESTLENLNCQHLDISPIFSTKKIEHEIQELQESDIAEAITNITFVYPIEINCTLENPTEVNCTPEDPNPTDGRSTPSQPNPTGKRSLKKNKKKRQAIISVQY